jgi:hypothetical protein
MPVFGADMTMTSSGDLLTKAYRAGIELLLTI